LQMVQSATICRWLNLCTIGRLISSCIKITRLLSKLSKIQLISKDSICMVWWFKTYISLFQLSPQWLKQDFMNTSKLLSSGKPQIQT
jgi:hypothetical protein